MDAITKDIFESSRLPDNSGYPILVITIVTLYIHWIISGIISEKKRVRLALYQREIYYKKLLVESLRMEEKKLAEVSGDMQQIKQLAQESGEIKFQLGDDVEIDQVDEKNIETVSEEGSIESEFNDIERLQDRIDRLRQQAEELYLTDREIVSLCKNLEGIEPNHEYLAQLKKRISKFEANKAENQQRIEAIMIDALPISEELDAELMRSFEDIELESLQHFLETLIELKATKTEEEFSDYLASLTTNKANQALELTESIIQNKETEIRLKHLKGRQAAEVAELTEERIELILKLNGAVEFLERLKEKNKLQRELMQEWRDEVEYTRNELTKWRDMFHETVRYARALRAQ